MDVKAAVRQAKSYVATVFEEEKPENLGLEEVEFEEAANEWLVTIGFSRPWERPMKTIGNLVNALPSGRSYKVIRISDATGEVRSVKNYETRH